MARPRVCQLRNNINDDDDEDDDAPRKGGTSPAAKGKRRAQKRRWTLLGQGHGGRRSCHSLCISCGIPGGGRGSVEEVWPRLHDDFDQDGVSIYAALPSCRGAVRYSSSRDSSSPPPSPDEFCSQEVATPVHPGDDGSRACGLLEEPIFALDYGAAPPPVNPRKLHRDGFYKARSGQSFECGRTFPRMRP